MVFGKNKFIAVILAVMVAVTWSFPAFAADAPEADTGEDKSAVVNEEPAKEEKPEAEPKPEPAEEPSAEPEDEPEAEPADNPSSNEGQEDSGDAAAPADIKVSGENNAKATDTTDAKNSAEEETTLENGTYKPDKVEFTGGSGRVTFTCEKVIVVNKKATAVFQVNTDNVTHAYMGKTTSREENPSLYDPKTGKTGEDVYTFGKRQVSVPVVLNKTKDFSGRTNAMSAASRWISYTYTITLSPEATPISDSTEIPENPASLPEEGEGTDPADPTNPTNPTEPTEPTLPTNPKDKQKLTQGTWKVKATTKRQMFYLYPKKTDPAWVILKVNKDKSMTATITLSGTGYDYVYMGTPAQARSAGKSKWIKAKIVNGYYTFTVPVKALDKKLAITPHSYKYEHDGDPTTDPWRPDKWIIFYSKDAVKVKSGTKIKTGTRKKSELDKAREVKKTWNDAKNKGTSRVDNSTVLKDGVYKPDQFRWSGGSGRLAYIKCVKVTVKGGKAFATLEFASSKYDSLRANGQVYSKQGGGNSRFTIPVKLNANNTIIGRTTAMSMPHWIEYKVYIGIAGATAGKDGKKKDGKLVDTNKLTEEAPLLIGLENTGKTDIKYAKLFRIYQYEQGITLVCVDQYAGTGLYKKPKKEDQKKADAGDTTAEVKVEYDEEGKPIAKTANEFTDELYQNNVVNYLIAPAEVELPAGIEKDCIIIRKPVESTLAVNEEAADMISQLGCGDTLEDAEEYGTYDKPDFKKIVLNKTNLVVLPSEALPARLTKKSTDEEKQAAEEKTAVLQKLQMRYSSLAVPVMVGRSADEASKIANAEWIKVYGAIYGEEKAAGQLFDKYVKEYSKDNKKENADHEKE